MEKLMEYISFIIQGIVQGLTEFLPVSSSGHLNIVQHFFGITEDNIFLNVMLHVGTLISVCVFYHKLIARLFVAGIKIIKDIFTGKFSFKNMDDDRNLVVMLIVGLLPLFALFIPIGNDMKLKDLADLFSGDPRFFIVTGIALLATSALLLAGIMLDKYRTNLIEKGIAKKKERYSFLDAIVVGCVQMVAALFPGLSRSGSTLAAGQLRGISKQSALDYTFVLAIPSILAAAVLEFKDVITSDVPLSVNWGAVILGMVCAAVVGYLSIALFKWLLKTDKTYVFVIYTAVAGVLVVTVSIIEMVTGNIISL
ncbi:MAG: undecaprenyl-diphosphate phosphatase [Eubacteriales bacterium]|nr:undecaprenyl-diphosphate phosphatase [Eubacteriales bacterium]